MAAEARVTSSLQILIQSAAGRLEYLSQPTAFEVTVTGVKGPTPGAFTASVYGTNVDLSQLTTPGLCRIMNLDPTNWVDFGAWDPETLTYYPMAEVGPGETYVFKLSRGIQEQYGTGPGTGTEGGSESNRLRVRANAAPCFVVVEAFER